MKCGRMRALCSSRTHRKTSAKAALAMPPKAANSMIVKSSGTGLQWCGRLILTRAHELAVQPDECSHATTLTIATVGEEASRVSVCAPAATRHVFDAERRQAPAGELREITLPAAAGVLGERRGGAGIGGCECGAHLGTNLEMRRSDCRPEPREEPARLDPESHDRGFQYAGCKAPPAGVRGSDRGAVGGGKEHRHAVGHLHGADLACAPCEHRVRGYR